MENKQKTREILKRIDINKILLQNSNSTICPVKVGRGRNLRHKKDILGRLLRKCTLKIMNSICESSKTRKKIFLEFSS